MLPEGKCRRLLEEKHTEKNVGTVMKLVPLAGNDGGQPNATRAETEVGSVESETETENENCASVIIAEDRGLDHSTGTEVVTSLRCHHHLHHLDAYTRNLW